MEFVSNIPELSVAFSEVDLRPFIAAMQTVTIDKVVEIGGCISGLAGSWLLALKNRASKYGWVAYFLSNMFWLVFAALISRNWLLLQNVGFTLSSMVGIWNYILVVRYPALLDVRLNPFKGSRHA